MEDYIIMAIIVIVAVMGALSAMKHFKGKGGCCGGGGYKPKKKKLANVLYQKTFRVEGMHCDHVEGMHCDHCKTRVEEVINDMKGLAGKVDLKKGELTVSYAEEVSDEMIAARLEKVGYPMAEIK